MQASRSRWPGGSLDQMGGWRCRRAMRSGTWPGTRAGTTLLQSHRLVTHRCVYVCVCMCVFVYVYVCVFGEEVGVVRVGKRVVRQQVSACAPRPWVVTPCTSFNHPVCMSCSTLLNSKPQGRYRRAWTLVVVLCWLGCHCWPVMVQFFTVCLKLAEQQSLWRQHPSTEAFHNPAKCCIQPQE
jgi:hypothetical protein